MGNINIIAMNQLQDASSQKEALLYQAIRKVVEVEALAMQKLSQKLPVDVMQHLRERILLLKTKALHAYSHEDIHHYSLGFSDSQGEMRGAGEVGADNIEIDKPITTIKNLYSEGKFPVDSTLKPAQLPKRSLLSKAKALLGLPTSIAESAQDYYPTISFKQRGKTAGSAYLQRWEIRLNPILLAENSQQFIDEVIPHEYAHLLTFALYGRVQPHGREWQMMMTEVLGVPANRTHGFNTENSTTRQYERFTYTCLCQTHELTAIRHNRVQARKARYFCKHCGESLERREP